MEQPSLRGGEGKKEDDAAVDVPPPINAGDVSATNSHDPQQSRNILPERSLAEQSGTITTTLPHYPLSHQSAASDEAQAAVASEDVTPPSTEASSDIPNSGQLPITVADLQGHSALFFTDDPFAQTFDPSQVDDNDSNAPSEVNTIQAFAKLEFDDGEFYMTTYAVELGRDVRAHRREELSEVSSQQVVPKVEKSRKRRMSSDKAGRSRKRRMSRKIHTGSVVSESGGVIGVDPPDETDEERSPSSSQQHLSRRSSYHAPKMDYNRLTLEHADWMGHQTAANVLEPPPPYTAEQISSVDKIPLIPIHPPANADGSAAGHLGISRKHVKIFFNFELHLFQVIFLGKNGGFVDDYWYARNETVTLVSGSIIQIQGICCQFTLPNVPEGETGAEDAELDEGLSGGDGSYDKDDNMNDSDESDILKHPFDGEDGGGVMESEEVDDESGEELPRQRAKPRRRKESDPDTIEAPKPKRKGPGRPPKNGIMSKREQAQQAREARENAKAKGEVKSNGTQGRGKGKTAKALELEASRLQPNGKRKYTKRKKAVEAEEVPKVRESTEQEDSVSPEAATKTAKDKKPIKPPRSPSPVFNEAELTPEQLQKPTASYVVLIHEALSNSKTGQMSLPQIYRAIERRYPFFKLRAQTQGWQSSVRHNLSQHAAFTKITRDGKGWMWGLVPEVSIEKEKKRRTTPPPAPQSNYQYPPQPPRYPQHTHPYPYPNVPAPAHGAMPFPYAVPPMPYPPRLGANGIPMPFVQPQAESTYKSPYDSKPDPAPAATTTTSQPAINPSGINGHYQPPTPHSQHQQPPTAPPSAPPAPNGAHSPPNPPQQGNYRYSEDFLTMINAFKVQLIKSLNPQSNPEALVSSVINHKLYGAALKAVPGSDERLILTALEGIMVVGGDEAGKQRAAADPAAAAAAAATATGHSVETVTERATDIARKIQDDKDGGGGQDDGGGGGDGDTDK